MEWMLIRIHWNECWNQCHHLKVRLPVQKCLAEDTIIIRWIQMLGTLVIIITLMTRCEMGTCRNLKHIHVIDLLVFQVDKSRWICYVSRSCLLFVHCLLAASRSTHDVRNRDYASNRLYLDLDRNGRRMPDYGLGGSPPSDSEFFDNQCYATTPSSSNGNSDLDQPSHSVEGDFNLLY